MNSNYKELETLIMAHSSQVYIPNDAKDNSETQVAIKVEETAKSIQAYINTHYTKRKNRSVLGEAGSKGKE